MAAVGTPPTQMRHVWADSSWLRSPMRVAADEESRVSPTHACKKEFNQHHTSVASNQTFLRLVYGLEAVGGMIEVFSDVGHL